MSTATIEADGQSHAHVPGSQPLIVGRFVDASQAAATRDELREHWAAHQHPIPDDLSTREAAIGVLQGIAIGAPLSSLAMLGLLDLIMDLWGYGPAAMNQAWMLGGLIIGAFLGLIIGGFVGLYIVADRSQAHVREVPLSDGDVLIVAMPGTETEDAQSVMQRHHGQHVTTL